MAIVRYHPSANLVNELKNGMGWLLDPGHPSLKNKFFQPSVDIKEEDSRYVVFADIPGVASKDIKISLEQNVLTIHGEKCSESAIKENGYYRVERASGKFHRQFVLPKNADGTKIEATSKDGVLEITIPKTELTPTKYIEVR